jgi:hypothetical protein
MYLLCSRMFYVFFSIIIFRAQVYPKSKVVLSGFFDFVLFRSPLKTFKISAKPQPENKSPTGPEFPMSFTPLHEWP